jgi:hypothetical protein
MAALKAKSDVPPGLGPKPNFFEGAHLFARDDLHGSALTGEGGLGLERCSVLLW